MPAGVSVVIPTYNRADEVERAIVSIREPELAVEIIVVDDGSTDGTPERLRQRKDIRYIRLSRNAGQAAARNEGVAAATFPYIAFLDSDDVRLPGTLAWQVARLQEWPECALAYGRYSHGDESLARRMQGQAALPEGDIYEELLRFNIIAPSASVVRASVLREVGGFDPRYRRSEEWDLWLRICARYNVCAVEKQVVIISPPIDASHASGDPVKMEWTSARVFRAHLRSPDCRPMDTETRRRTQRRFTRLRIDLMLWKVLAQKVRPAPALRLRCVFACIALDPGYMLRSFNLKNLAKLLSPFWRNGDAKRPGIPAR